MPFIVATFETTLEEIIENYEESLAFELDKIHVDLPHVYL